MADGRMKSAILVTGAGGFIGRTLLPRLIGTFPLERVIGLDFRPRPPDWHGEWLEGGLERLTEVPGTFIVAHLAWDLRRGDPAAQEASLESFRAMLRIPGLAGVVGMGSAEEYGSAEGRLDESRAPGNALSAYGRAKQDAFRAVAASGLRCIWLRPFIVYGEGQGGNMVVPYALRCAKEGCVAEFSSGDQFRDFVHVEDVAAGIAAAVRGVLTLPEGECRACNLGRGAPVKVRDVLERIARQTGREQLFRFGVRPMRAGEPAVQFAATDAAESVLGWKAAIPWQEGIDRLCRNLEATK